MFENFGAFGLRQILQDRHGIVGFHLADALGDGLRRQLFEDFLAHRVVDLGQCGKIEVDAEQFNQTRALFGLERLQHRTKIGFMQIANQGAQRRDIGRIDGAVNLCDEFGVDRALVVPHRRRRLGLFSRHADLGVL